MINDFIKKNLTLSSLLIFSLLIIINNFYRFFQNNSVYEFDPWLSNYQGGFVRRGLIGEIFFQIYKFSLIGLDIIVFFFVSLFYIFFAINLIKLLNEIKFSYLNLLIIFSPLSFFYPVMEQKVSGRKDILFLFLLTFKFESYNVCIYVYRCR